MSGFTFFKRGECPVCENSSRGCRESNSTGLVFCRDSGANPSNYLYRGEDVHGFGLWQSTDDADAFTSKSTESKQRERREFLKLQEQRRREQIARQMSESERDRWYRQLLAELNLTESDRQKLLERGFSPEQISDDGYKSISKWHKLKNTYPANLPGILSNGVLNVPADGILCPIRNQDGLIVGCQVRLHEATDGRYRWLTSATKKNPEGSTCHLDRELPIGVFEPEQFKGDSIWLTEGTSIKPSLTRYRLGVPVVGASSGRFNTSPEFSRKAIAYLSAKYQTKILTFAVDAGDAVNSSGVPERWQQQIEFFSSLGYECRLAWWNQITKNECDIDELNDYSQIKFISINEFLSIAQNQQTGEQKTQQIQVNSSSDWREEYELKRSDRAKIKFTRKPDVEVKDGYLPTDNLKDLPEGIIGLKGDWGIGKSYFTANLCKQWSGNILQIAHLNAILHNTAPKYDLMHHHEVKKLNLSLTSVPKLSICDVTFAANFNPESWVKGEPFLLILDEITQGLKSLHTSPNLRGNLRIKARTKLEWLIKNATYIIAADRDLDNETLEYIERVKDDGKKSFIIHHIGKKGKFHKPITINNNKHKDEVLTRLKNDVKAGLKCAIACENKTDLIAIELLLKDTGIAEESIFFAHGDNSNEPHIKPIIQEIDSQYTDYPVVGYTMTMGSAISLEKQHFDRVYAFFTGDVLAASDQCQMLFRYRLDCEIIIWVSPRRRTLEIDPKNLLKNLQINIDETDKLISSIDAIATLHKKGIMPTVKGVITEDELPFLQHKLSIISRINASKANPFQSLYDLLIDAGFIINLECTDTEEPTRTEEGEIHVEQKKAVKEEGDRLIAQAELMNDVEFESARINAGSLRKSERDRLQKTQLHRDTNLEITQDIVKLQRTKNLTRGARKLRVLLGDDDTAIAYDLADRERNPDKGDQSFYAANRRLLCDIGTLELIAKLKDGWSYTNDSPEIQEFADRLRKRKADVKRLLGFTVSIERNSKGNFKISNTELFNRVLDSLCLFRTSFKQTKDSKRSNVYTLDKEYWELLQKIMAHMDSQSHTPTLEGIIQKAKDSVISIDLTPKLETVSDISEEWLAKENIQDTALILESCDSAEMLQDVRISIPAFVLKSAAKLLPLDKQKLLKNWVIELNQQLESAA